MSRHSLRRGHRGQMVPLSQMVPAEPNAQQRRLFDALPVPDASVVDSLGRPTSGAEANSYWERALGGAPTAPGVIPTPAAIRNRRVSDESGDVAEARSETRPSDSYWDRARGAVPRRPIRPEPAASDLATASDAVAAPVFPVAPVSVAVPMLFPAAGSAEGVCEAYTRNDSPLVAPVRGAHVKADDPLAAASSDAQFSEAHEPGAVVSGAHVRADDPLANEEQAAHVAEGSLHIGAADAVPQAEDGQPQTSADDDGPQAANDHASLAGSRRHRRRWRVVPIAGGTAALAVGLGAGSAFAYITSQGSGTGLASTGSATGITVTAVASPGADSNLYPGGPGVAVQFTVNNPNPYNVSFTGWSAAALSSVTPVGSNTCTTGDFHVAASAGTFSPTLSIPANTASSPGVSGTASGVVQLLTTAQNGCQGATVTVTLTLTGGRQS